MIEYLIFIAMVIMIIVELSLLAVMDGLRRKTILLTEKLNQMIEKMFNIVQEQQQQKKEQPWLTKQMRRWKLWK